MRRWKRAEPRSARGAPMMARDSKEEGKSTAIDGCTGATVRQPLRPLHVLQPEIAVDVYVRIGDRDRKCDGEPGQRPPSGGDDGLRRRRSATTARLVELLLAVHHDRFVHEVRGCAELIRYDTRDTLVVEQQQSPDR